MQPEFIFKYYSSSAVFGISDLKSFHERYSNGDPNNDFIYHLVYFSKYPSNLFLETRKIGKQKIFYSMDVALSRITQAFGAKMTYCGVVNALTVLNTDALLNSKLKVLLSNERLEITSLDVTNFRAVKSLHDISTPIQYFITAYVQYKFQIVDNDTTFNVLQAEVNKFYNTESNDRPTCLSFLDRLYTILCLNPHNQTTYKHLSPHLSLLHKINELTKVIPILRWLSYISYGPKLRQYFRETKWFENDDSAITI